PRNGRREFPPTFPLGVEADGGFRQIGSGRNFGKADEIVGLDTLHRSARAPDVLDSRTDSVRYPVGLTVNMHYGGATRVSDGGVVATRLKKAIFEVICLVVQSGGYDGEFKRLHSHLLLLHDRISCRERRSVSRDVPEHEAWTRWKSDTLSCHAADTTYDPMHERCGPALSKSIRAIPDKKRRPLSPCWHGEDD